MTHFLATAEQPQGHRLEDVLRNLRTDLVIRMGKIVQDERPEAQQVLANDARILDHLMACIGLAEDSSRVLMKAFGPSRPGTPRIGTV